MNGKHAFMSAGTPPRKETFKGVTIKPLAGQHAMIMHAELAPGVEVPIHSHPHEQLGIVIEGELDFRIADEERRLRPGDMYMIAGGTPHGLRTGKERVVLAEFFHPIREEYFK